MVLFLEILQSTPVSSVLRFVCLASARLFHGISWRFAAFVAFAGIGSATCCFFVLVRGNVLSFTGFLSTFSLPFVVHFSSIHSFIVQLDHIVLEYQIPICWYLQDRSLPYQGLHNISPPIQLNLGKHLHLHLAFIVNLTFV